MTTMESASEEIIIQGHERFKAKVYFHHSRDFKLAYFDIGVVLDRRTMEEYEYTPGLFGISEGVYVAAEDESWEVASS